MIPVNKKTVCYNKREVKDMSKKAADIYREIMDQQDKAEIVQESCSRNLRKKMTFLIEQVALRHIDEFKDGNNIYIPDNDVPIVRNLLMCSLDDQYPYIVRWFNNSIDLNDANDCIHLYNSVKKLIERIEKEGETDSVTANEWRMAIRGLLNVDMAIHTINLKNKLEEFRVNTLVRSNTISCGDVIATYENGCRKYIKKAEKKEQILSENLLEKIVQNLSIQEDYYQVIEQIMDYLMKDAEKKAISDIEKYAKMKKISGCDTAKEMICDLENYTMISEYFPKLKKIRKFLEVHPEEKLKIERQEKVNHLEKFFE